MIKSTLTRSIRRPQKHDLIGRNVAELADLPEGQPGRPSRVMTQQQAAEVLQAAAGQPAGYVAVVTIGKYRQAATHAAGAAGELACGNKPRNGATVTHVSDDLTAATCRACRTSLGLDQPATDHSRLAALFVVAITLGLSPGELRALRWDHVNLDQQTIHVWRSGSRSGDTKTPKSRRTLALPSAPQPRSGLTRSARDGFLPQLVDLTFDSPALLSCSRAAMPQSHSGPRSGGELRGGLGIWAGPRPGDAMARRTRWGIGRPPGTQPAREST